MLKHGRLNHPWQLPWKHASKRDQSMFPMGLKSKPATGATSAASRTWETACCLLRQVWDMGEFGLKIRHRCVSQSEGGGIRGTQKSHCFRVFGSPISWKLQIWWYSLVLPRGGYTWVCSVRDWVELWISEGGPGWSGHVLRSRRTYILLTNDSMPFWFGKWASCETIGTWRLHPS